MRSALRGPLFFLANMADLKTVVADNALYVTSLEKVVRLEEELQIAQRIIQ